MKAIIQLLQVEDSAEDAELIVRLLERAGYQIHAQRVECEEQMRAALDAVAWDLIIADYRLPMFSAPAALAVYQQAKLDIPFLVVSGAIGEEVAVGIMRAGAHDYLLKDQLERLPPAVERELHEAAIRKDKRTAEAKLLTAYSELETIYANAPMLLFITDRQLCIEKTNQQAARFCGRTPAECVGMTICEALHCEQAAQRIREGKQIEPCMSCALARGILGSLIGEPPSEPIEVATPLPLFDPNQPSYLLASVNPIAIHDRRRSVLLCAQDVTRRKRVEHELEKSVESLRTALKQNEVLFQEVHHRVKNNLQIVASLLSMKARKPRELLGAEDLKDCERRIRSMATIHEQLYSQKDMSVVDFAEYAARIVPDLIASYEGAESIVLHMLAEPVVLTIDQSIPCGLILNELITNAVKYAYPDRKGEIAVRVQCHAGAVELSVTDRGVGILPGTKASPTSLGAQIIQMLTKQLKGTLDYSAPPGLAVTLRFPLARETERKAVENGLAGNALGQIIPHLGIPPLPVAPRHNASALRCSQPQAEKIIPSRIG